MGGLFFVQITLKNVMIFICRQFNVQCPLMVELPSSRPQNSVGKSSDVNNQVNGPKDMEEPVTTNKTPGSAKGNLESVSLTS